MQGIVRYQRRLRWLCRKRIIIHLFYILVSAWKVLNPMFTKMNIKHSSQSKGKSTLNIHWKDWCWNPILWLPDAKSGLIRKDPRDGKDRRQEEKGNVRGWYVWMASPTQWTWIWASSRRWWRKGSLVCCSSQGCKESDTTEQLNNSNLKSAWQHQSEGLISYNIAHKIQLAKEIHPYSKSHLFTMLYYSIQGLATEIQREKI